MARRALCIASIAGSSLLVAQPALAQVPLAAFERLRDDRAAQRLLEQGALFARGSAPRAAPELSAFPARWITAPSGRSLLRAGSLDLRSARRMGAELWWTPPRHLLLDRARETLGLDTLMAPLARTGQGVVIGIIDAGIDVSHPDLRNSDGTTRIAWWLDFGSDPAGRHPALEAALGCEPRAGLRCQVLSAADLDERLANAIAGDEPEDPLGHGTHVASIAAGNGLSGGGYVGVAPEATLVVARVTDVDGTISDADVVLATEFVFERAGELGMPAIANLSLGSDFGAHDGSSELSRALADLVGPEWPGRALVVAAGNSGALSDGSDPALAPLGIHAELNVTSGAPGTLSIHTPDSGANVSRASVFVWLNLYSADNLSVGLILPDGSRLDPIGRGQADSVTSVDGGVVAAVMHGLVDAAEQDVLEGALSEIDRLQPSDGAAVALITGAWPARAWFEVLLEGSGRVEAWLQSEGDLAPEAGSLGASFGRATARQTVTIPAAHPELVAVGASINRVEWTDADGFLRRMEPGALVPGHGLGEIGFFSSAGPNARGDIKPDLVAPGGFVIAAMAAAADPRSGGLGIFSGLCPERGCQVVSARHGVTAGTSMASPMVSGAMALLLQGDPTLTQAELRSLLQAGAGSPAVFAEPRSRAGAGVLDIARALEVERASISGADAVADPEQSRLELGNDFIWADATRSLGALLWLSEGTGEVLDPELERLSVSVEPGVLHAGPERVAPGLYAFRIAASPDRPRAGARVRVLLDGRELFDRAVPSSDPLEPSGAGGSGWCGLSQRAPDPSTPLLAPAPLLLLLRRLRSRRGRR